MKRTEIKCFFCRKRLKELRFTRDKTRMLGFSVPVQPEGNMRGRRNDGWWEKGNKQRRRRGWMAF